MSAKTHSQMRKQLNAKPPEPPKDYLPRFKESTHFTFNEYLKARPYSDWNAADLRVLAQICLLEDMLQAAQDEIDTTGITVLGSKGQPVSNPAMAVMIKAQQQQGSMMRRLGIAVGGIDNKQKAQKDADFIKRQEEIEANPNSHLLA